MNFSIVLCCDKNYGIGDSNDSKRPTYNGLLWKIDQDLSYFNNLTSVNVISNLVNVIIMGRSTADFFKKPLKNRLNVVITSKNNYRQSEGFESFMSLNDALNNLSIRNNIGNIFVIGGAKLANDAIKHRYCKKIYLTQIDQDYNCSIKLSDQFIKIHDNYHIINRTTYECYDKLDNEKKLINITTTEKTYVNHEETQYLDLLERILKLGDYRETRNAKTYSLFGEKLVFDLDNGLPVLTTKKMFCRGIIEELIFFLQGKTDTKILEDKKVMIWHDNTTKEFISNNKKNLKEYDMGPMYGFQWRHFNAEYKGCDQNYNNAGVDQLKLVVDTLINDPHSRRIMMTCFNPAQAEQGVLYPCHGIVVQFYLERDSRISLQMYQRSVDSFLGLPFNITSYAILLHIIVNLVNNNKNRKHKDDYRPGRIIMILGDTHIYSDQKGDHTEQVRTQLNNRYNSNKFPELVITKKLCELDDLNNLTVDDIIIKDYVSCPVIKAKMIA